ncbi:MAG: hypothetical protein IKA45_06110 [Bacteroidales bacterium]|nr:hypothetical protein [Bacteroidales bacterium]
MTKKLQDLQEVKKQLDILANDPMDEMIPFLQKVEPVEIALKKAARCPKTDEEKALAKEVKAQFQQIQIAFDKKYNI